MSTMEQALRDEIAWHRTWIKQAPNKPDASQHLARIYVTEARLAALTAALPAPGVEAPGDWVMVPRRATDAMTEAAKEYLDATDLEIGMAYDLMLAAAPSAPAEISQAQAQAMREALVWIVDHGPPAEYEHVARAALTPEPPR